MRLMKTGSAGPADRFKFFQVYLEQDFAPNLLKAFFHYIRRSFIIHLRCGCSGTVGILKGLHDIEIDLIYNIHAVGMILVCLPRESDNELVPYFE